MRASSSSGREPASRARAESVPSSSKAAALKEAGRPFTRAGSMAKVFGSEKANRACDVAVQVHGGYGYIDEFPAERHYRDVRITTIYEGSSEIQRIVIARDLLKD